MESVPEDMRSEIAQRVHIAQIKNEYTDCSTYGASECAERAHRCRWDPLSNTCSVITHNSQDPFDKLLLLAKKPIDMISSNSLRRWILRASQSILHLKERELLSFPAITYRQYQTASEKQLLAYCKSVVQTINEIDRRRRGLEAGSSSEDSE